MTKRSDMASRYAAAHARREQRRKQAGGREYLPLAQQPLDEAPPTGARTAPGAARLATAGAGYRLPTVDYSYLRSDLMRTAVLAIGLFVVMIILSLVIHV